MKQLNFLDSLLNVFGVAQAKEKSFEECMEERLEMWGVSFRVVRKARQKVMRLSIKPGHLPRVSANLSVTSREIEHFVRGHEAWILRTLQKVKEYENAYPKVQFIEDEKFYFFGNERTLKTRVTPLTRAFVSSDISHIYLNIPEKEWKQRSEIIHWAHYRGLVESYYKREAEKYIRTRVLYLGEKTGLKPTKIGFRAQKTRWGSCNSKGHLSLNWKLIVAPRDVIDYVIIHELCHLKYLNHSEAFWALVEKWDPQYTESEKWLRRNVALVDFLNH